MLPRIDRPLLRTGGVNLLKQADDDEDFSTETEKMMKDDPGLKGAMLYARRRRIEKATARELARNAAISTTLPLFQFVNEKGEDTVDAFIARQTPTKRRRTRGCGRESSRRRKEDNKMTRTKSRDRGTHAGRIEDGVRRSSGGSILFGKAIRGVCREADMEKIMSDAPGLFA